MVIAISGVSEDMITAFAADNGITYPILRDTGVSGGAGFGGDVYDLYYIPNQGSPYPRDFIIDREGIIQYANNEIDTEYMLYVLEILMDENVGIESENVLLPVQMELLQPFPNPFNPTTTIRFNVPIETQLIASLRIYDLTGRLVETLIDKQLKHGKHKIKWNASNQPSGIYIAKLSAGNQVQTQKLVLVK